MGNAEVKIFDIMECDVYWDFENSPMPKETHKFAVENKTHAGRRIA
jgi:hypothetical protein